MHQKKQVGFLGGTFDPIHIGHLNLALEAQDQFGLDEVLFCPTYVSPFKKEEGFVASPQDRLKMTALAIEDIKGFKVLDYEMTQTCVSYTVDTIKFLKTTHPDKDYFLILGEDHLGTFMSWKGAVELMELAPLKIGSRDGVCGSSALQIPQKYHDTLKKGCFKIHNLEISSTELRDALALGRYCKHLIPSKVVDYIHEHRLYSTH